MTFEGPLDRIYIHTSPKSVFGVANCHFRLCNVYYHCPQPHYDIMCLSALTGLLVNMHLMCVHMCIYNKYICIYIWYTYTHVHIHIHIHIHELVCIYVYTYTCI